jgi:hypothetical protein
VRSLPVGGRGSAAKTFDWLFVRRDGGGRGKNSPRRVHLSKRLRTQTVGKARRAGALYGGRRRLGERRDPEAPGAHDRKVVGFRRAGGEPRRETRFGWILEERAREVESPGEQGPRPELTVWGAKRGTAFPVGESRWSAGARPEWFRRKAQERKGEERFCPDHRRGAKALKGEARERWGLKEAFKGLAS